MLIGIQNGLRSLWRLDDVVLGTLDATRLRPLVEHKLGASSTAISLWQVTIVAATRQIAI